MSSSAQADHIPLTFLPVCSPLDISPPIYLFSPSIPFPSSTSSLPPSTALPLFRTALRRRVADRTPLLDLTLHELEHLAARLKADLDTLRSAAGASSSEGGEDARAKLLLESFEPRAREALKRFGKELEGLLDVVGVKGEGENGEREAIRIRKEAFVARLALHLATGSTVVKDILGGPDESSGSFSFVGSS
jgi:hypothetical protein